jgi:hypothetical protein
MSQVEFGVDIGGKDKGLWKFSTTTHPIDGMLGAGGVRAWGSQMDGVEVVRVAFGGLCHEVLASIALISWVYAVNFRFRSRLRCLHTRVVADGG